MPSRKLAFDPSRLSGETDGGRSGAAGWSRSFSSGVLVYQVRGEAIHGIHTRFRHGGVELTPIVLAGDGQAARFFENHEKRLLAVGVLPRSQYLSRTLEIPKVGPEETRRMLALEAETFLAPEFGQFETSHVVLPTESDTSQRVEVYIARRAVLDRWLSAVSRSRAQCALILPSAVIWRRLLGAFDGADLLVAQGAADEEAELAYLEADQSLCARAIQPLLNKEAGQGLPPGLIESLRTLIASAGRGNKPVVIGWLGHGCPSGLQNGRIICQSVNEQLCSVTETDSEAAESNAFLLAATQVLMHSRLGVDHWIQTSNLLPREIVLRRQQRSVYKRMAVGAASVLLSAILASAAMRIAIFRYRTRIAALSNDISMIKTEGEAVGRRIRQLEAIRATRETQGDLCNVLAGLYEATPDGVTYSHVRLDEAGSVRLQGQAPSLSLPFLLPERLEKQPMFVNVVPRDAGQIKKGGGTVAEFRIDCRLKRQEN